MEPGCSGDGAAASLTLQQKRGLLPEDLHQRLVQVYFLELGQQLLFVATHLLLGVEAVRHRPLLAQAHQRRLHSQRHKRFAFLQERQRRVNRVLRPPAGAQGAWWGGGRREDDSGKNKRPLWVVNRTVY